MLPVILISLSLHEYAHGYTAWKCGDDTAKSLGRLSINPLKHLDPIGFGCLLLFGFGWAKPVPINTRYFRNPRRDIRLVSLAGPLTNCALALMSHFVYRIVIQLASPAAASYQMLSYYNLLQLNELDMLSLPVTLLLIFLSQMVFTNVVLFIFNLIPIPPLDGSKILISILPQKAAYFFLRNERVISLVLYALLLLGLLSGPLSTAVYYIVYGFDYLLMLLPFFG
ncbi:MAG TPA: site-2 protease family protein [Bacillota bacterium]|nr:site-2 protease family protein [Bacillota bacterium]